MVKAENTGTNRSAVTNKLKDQLIDEFELGSLKYDFSDSIAHALFKECE